MGRLWLRLLMRGVGGRSYEGGLIGRCCARGTAVMVKSWGPGMLSIVLIDWTKSH